MAEDKLNPAEAQEFLAGMNYPADRDEIVKHAESSGADRNVITFLERLPNREYDGPTDVSQGLSEVGEIE
jgi:hypothetical protein